MKVTLAERLQLRRIRNDELAALYANDVDDERACGSGIKDLASVAALQGDRSRLHVAIFFWLFKLPSL